MQSQRQHRNAKIVLTMDYWQFSSWSTDVTATWIMVNAHMQWNMDEMNWLLKVKTNLDCHSREEHVKGHRGETIPEDENSNQSLFPRIKRLHVCWIIKPNRYFVSQIFVKSYLCLQSITFQRFTCVIHLTFFISVVNKW